MNNDRNSGKIIAGLIVIGVGSVLLLRQMGYIFAPWLFTWPMILIVIGLISGVKHRFRTFGWLFMILLGSIFLADEIDPSLHVGTYAWPILLILLGIWMILARNKNYGCKNNRCRSRRSQRRQETFNQSFNITDSEQGEKSDNSTRYKSDDFLDTVSVFGGVSKKIFSKEFKGGEIINIFGGAEIDLTQADIQGRVELEVVQIFGGTKIVLPPHWQVNSDIAAVFGGIDDKRNNSATVANSDKILVLKGVSIFAGIEIRSY